MIAPVTAMPHWPLPQFGDLVWCRFPYGGHPTNARHPCLVLEIYSEAGKDPEVMVAGGTSANKDGQWKRKLKPSDFLLQGLVLLPAGLSNPTAIQFEANAVTTLPWNDTYFVVIAPKTTPVIGSIDVSRNPLNAAFQNAGRAGNLKDLVQAEKARIVTKKMTP